MSDEGRRPQRRNPSDRTPKSNVPVPPNRKEPSPRPKSAPSNTDSETNPSGNNVIKKYEIARQITSPLNFFALVAMIIEIIFGVVVVKSKFSADQQFWAFLIMAGLFLMLIVGVGILTYLRPTHLSQEMAEALRKSEQALEVSQRVKEVIEDEGFREVIAEIVEEVLSNPQEKPDNSLTEMSNRKEV